ncbi:MAG: tetratricopeptide repeat protein [Gammaproteobacteria bacterium]|nr:MAG: tetratricopeptide repeat protein [Gammaproteobacteria bacterium]
MGQGWARRRRGPCLPLLGALLGALLLSLPALPSPAAAAPAAAPSLRQALERLRAGDLQGAAELLEELVRREPRNAEALFYLANARLRLGDVTGGLQALEASVRADPDNLRLRLVLGRTYERLRRIQEALAVYREAARRGGQGPEGREARKRARLLEAKALGEEGKLQEALERFQALAREAPEDPEVLRGLGLTQLLMGRTEEAKATFQRVLALAPKDPAAHRYLADIAYGAGDFQEAEAHYREVERLAPPGSPLAEAARLRLLIIRGLRALDGGDYRAAAQAFEEALRLSPRDPVARLNLAAAYRGLERYERAEDLLLGILQDQPDNLDARLRLGALYLETGRPAQAAQALEEVVDRAPGSAQAEQARDLLEQIYATPEGAELRRQRERGRIATLEERVRAAPRDADAWAELARLLADQGELDRAEEAYGRALALRPADPKLLEAAAALAERRGDFATAAERFARALALAEDPAAQRRLRDRLRLAVAERLYSEGHLEAAAAWAREVLAEEPDNVFAHYLLGLVAGRRGRPEEAVAAYREVLRLFPGHLGAHMNLAATYEQLGRLEEAMAQYRAVMRSGPPELAADAAARLAELRRRARGFSYALSYSLGYDDNSNLSRTDPVEQLRTDLDGSITYQRKLRGRPLTWGLSFSPGYTVFHQDQFDLLDLQTSPFLELRRGRSRWSLSLSHSETKGLLVAQLVSRSNAAFLTVERRLNWPAWLPFLAGEDERRAAPTLLQLNLSRQVFKSASSPLFDARTGTGGLFLSQSLGGSLSWELSYGYTVNTNSRPEGNDFAYRGHDLGLRLRRGLATRLSASLGYTASYRRYSHPDSATRFTRRRVNLLQSASLGLSFFPREGLSLFLSYSYQQNDSNLPTGLILSPQDVGVAIGLQSPSLGDYRRQFLSLGLSLSL